MAITSAFLDLFGDASHKIIINTTGNADSDNAIASFGQYQTGIAARKMALNILTKERPDIKVWLLQKAQKFLEIAKKLKKI